MTTRPARIGAALALAMGTALLWAVPAQAAPGDLDPSFGGDGTVTLDVAEEQGNAVALAPDGDTVVVGTVTEETGEINHYAGRGSPDRPLPARRLVGPGVRRR